MCRSSASLRPLSAGTPGASVWPSPKQILAHPHIQEMPINLLQPRGMWLAHLATSTHEDPSLRESGEQDQHQENEPHVHTAAADAHGLCR